jgi:hypothetical protein
LDFRIALSPFGTDSPSRDQIGEIRALLEDPRGLVLDHVREHEVFPKVGMRLERAARALGYRREVVRTIPDSNGRPMFEVMRFVSDGP